MHRGTGATNVRTLALATYFKSVEHIKEFCTYINYRDLIDIYEEYYEYKGYNFNIIYKL